MTHSATPRGRIAANVRAELARRDLTNADMVAGLGRSISFWQRRTSGEIEFATTELLEVGAWLDVKIDVLLEGVLQVAGMSPEGPDANRLEQHPRVRRGRNLSSTPEYPRAVGLEPFPDWVSAIPSRRPERIRPNRRGDARTKLARAA